MRIRSAITFLGFGALAIAATLGAQSALALLRSEETTATVIAIAAVNVNCKRRIGASELAHAGRREGCTRFTAQARFAANDRDYVVALPAGVFHGRDRPVDDAEVGAGQRLRVVYLKADPATAQRRLAFTGMSFLPCLLWSLVGLVLLALGRPGRDR